MKKNKFKPSLLHPVKRHQYKKRVKIAGEAWANFSLSMNRFAEQISKAMTPLDDAIKDVDKKMAKALKSVEGEAKITQIRK